MPRRIVLAVVVFALVAAAGFDFSAAQNTPATNPPGSARLLDGA